MWGGLLLQKDVSAGALLTAQLTDRQHLQQQHHAAESDNERYTNTKHSEPHLPDRVLRTIQHPVNRAGRLGAEEKEELKTIAPPFTIISGNF